MAAVVIGGTSLAGGQGTVDGTALGVVLLGVVANFRPYTPRTYADANAYDWLGKDLYSHGYQTSCRAVDGKLVCRPTRTWLTERE